MNPVYQEVQTCEDCGRTKTLGYFNKRKDGKRQKRCVKCPAPPRPGRHQESQNERRTITPPGLSWQEQESARRRYGKYKIDWWQWQEMLADCGGRCAICNRETDLVVDHDHKCCPTQRTCGKCVRGLLCAGCNTGLGAFGDNPEALASALDYLRDSK